MVETRSKQTKVDVPKDEVSVLRAQVERLNAENQSLSRQFKLICEEYDILKQSLKSTATNKSTKKKNVTHTYSQTDYISENLNGLSTDDTERVAYQDILTNIILDHYVKDFSFSLDVKKGTPCFQSNVASKPPKVSSPHAKAASSPTQKTSSSARQTSQVSKRPRVIVISTSLVRDVSLSSVGLNGITYCYPGQYIPFICSRVESILKDESPDFVILQCGGNDLERFANHKVIIQYERLITTVQKLAPFSTILLSSVPPRGVNANLLERIEMLNTYLRNKAKTNISLEYIEICPFLFSHFKRDNVHFNDTGSFVYNKNLAKEVIYFYSIPKPQVTRVI